MNNNFYSTIVGTGSYIPTKKIPNKDFLKKEFYKTGWKKFDKTNQKIIDKFEQITNITE